MRNNSVKNVLVLLANGFEEIETVTPVDILRRSGARVTLAGLSSGSIEGSRGISINPDCSINEVDIGKFDLVVIPGGLTGTTNLANDHRVLELLQNMHTRGNLIAAICAGPIVLQSAGILKGQTLTSHPSVKNKLNKIRYSENRVMVDGNLITSQSPGTAMEFSMKLVELLFGNNRVQKVNKGVLAKI